MRVSIASSALLFLGSLVGCADAPPILDEGDADIVDAGVIDAPPAPPSRCLDTTLGDIQDTDDNVVNLLASVLSLPEDFLGLEALYCPFETRVLRVPTGLGVVQNRVVYYQTPNGEPPADGWPVVFIFQPTGYLAPLHWVGVKGLFGNPVVSATRDQILEAGGDPSDEDPSIFGQFYPTETIRQLLDAGYAVLTPYAEIEDGTVWETNIPAIDQLYGGWDNTKDGNLMEAIFAAIDAGDFGPLDPDHMFATGMSSGGYMTSRVALEYPERFRAVAVQSGAWATCLGPLCFAKSTYLLTGDTYDGRLFSFYPTTTAVDHPPTLFIHGKYDFIVPAYTMEAYEEALRAQGTPTRMILVEEDDLGIPATHYFFSVTPGEILSWFESYRN